MTNDNSPDDVAVAALPAQRPLVGEVLPPPRTVIARPSPNAADELTAIADRIRPRQRSIVEHIIASGQDLIRAKELLSHGEFLTWIAAEFGLSARTAQNYMAVARAFGAKGATVSYLPPNTLYRLAERATPESIREKVRRWLATGERPTALQIDDLIAEGRENVPKRELTEKHQLRMKRDRVFANRYRRKKREREQIAWRRREVFVQEIGPICPQDKLPFIIDFLEHADIEDVRSVGGRLRNYLRRKGYIGPMKDYRP